VEILWPQDFWILEECTSCCGLGLGCTWLRIQQPDL